MNHYYSAACVALSLLVVSSLSAQPKTPESTFTLNAQSRATIVLPDQPVPAERTAAEELQKYLGQVTGANLSIVAESAAPKNGTAIYLGPTKFAQTTLKTDFRPEQWAIQSVGDDLIISGGRPRGVLYGAYHFLEDVAGVRWWTPWEETVPARKPLVLHNFKLGGEPRFAYRDIFITYSRMVYGNDGGRWTARQRLNAQGAAPIDAAFGGSRKYGPPSHVHTFYLYLEPAKYFATHPEWYSLVKGKRTTAQAQLCLTNPAMRAEFLRLVKENIRKTTAAALANGEIPPDTYSVSENDNAPYWCECENCASLTAREGSLAGPLFDFVNFIADGVKQEFPEVLIDTLAYTISGTPPKTIKPRDNVVVRLTDAGSNPVVPVSDPQNKELHDRLAGWKNLTKRLRVWDYAITYGEPRGLPYPSAHTYQPDFRYFLSNNVEGVFVEHEMPIIADNRDFKTWVQCKLMENPDLDYNGLVQEFSDGYYGPAGKHFRQYLGLLEESAKAKQSIIDWYALPGQFAHIDIDFVRAADTIFDEAARAVQNDPVLSRRVRHARLPLDRATAHLYPKLRRQWAIAGQEGESFPFDAGQLAKSIEATWREQIALRFLPMGDDRSNNLNLTDELKRLETDLKLIGEGAKPVAVPQQFKDLPSGLVVDFPARLSRNWKDTPKVVPDPEAETGFATRLLVNDTPEADRAKYKLPLEWGIYDAETKKSVVARQLKADEVKTAGYNWYKLATTPLGARQYLYLPWNWYIQIELGEAFDAANPKQQYDVWARLKFTGPMFPHGSATEPDAIYVERVTVTPAQ